MSEEGVLLQVRRLSLSVDDWVRLSAMATELGQLRNLLCSGSSSDRFSSLALAAGWMHRRRRRLLKAVCCVTEDHRDQLISTCRRKLKLYRLTAFFGSFFVINTQRSARAVGWLGEIFNGT